MRLIHILYYNPELPRGLILKAFTSCLGPQTILLDELFRNQLRVDSPLTAEIKKHFGKGSIVPNHLTEQLIIQAINPASTQDILIVNYPRSVQQFESFESFAHANGLTIFKCWYFMHADFELFMKNQGSKWKNTFGEEITGKWVEAQETNVNQVESLKRFTQYPWACVSLTHETFKELDYIKGEILKNMRS